MPIPHFQVPLNLPHAATISSRIIYHLQRRPESAEKLSAAAQLASAISDDLLPYKISGENPPEAEAKSVIAAVAEKARKMVDVIENSGAGDDRLGQAVRNLFECLELGQEGAIASLRAGENPDSTLRPH
jgi:hypothetical protein